MVTDQSIRNTSSSLGAPSLEGSVDGLFQIIKLFVVDIIKRERQEEELLWHFIKKKMCDTHVRPGGVELALTGRRHCALTTGLRAHPQFAVDIITRNLMAILNLM